MVPAKLVVVKWALAGAWLRGQLGLTYLQENAMANEKFPEVIYLIYDGRYHSDPDRAMVLESCTTKSEAMESLKHWPSDSVLVKEGWDNQDIKPEVISCQ